ncbi:hypothetical protein Ancab_036043 [Ancistrocladus abbreviatus]
MEFKNEVKSEDCGITMKLNQEMDVKAEVKREEPSILLTPKQEMIEREQSGNMAPAAQMAMTRRVHTLASLNPYQGNWTIKGTQIQASMFNEAVRKLFDKFQMGKEAVDEGIVIPEAKFNFVPIDQLGPYVNGRDVVDVIGVVQSVSPMSIRRRSNNELILSKTVVVSLWDDLVTTVGQELVDMVDKSPVVAIKSLKVGDFGGLSLSSLSKSILQINPNTPESRKLRSCLLFSA